MRDVLILSAGYGAGHDMVAEALADFWLEKNPAARVCIKDFFDFVNPKINLAVKQLYIQSVRHAPQLYGAFYYATHDLPDKSRISKMINSLGSDRLLQFIKENQFDLIVCVYPTAGGVVAGLKNAGLIDVPVAIVITDFVAHNQWIHQGVDMYLVADETVKIGLAEKGIPEDTIAITGIPLRRQFADARPSAQRGCCWNEKLTVVLAPGAFGMMSGKNVALKACLSIEGIRLVVIGGKDASAKVKIERMIEKSKTKQLSEVRGFVPNMAQVMLESQVIITKSGGVTVAEALAIGIPVIIYRPIPGQEERNADYLMKNGAGLLAEDYNGLVNQIGRLTGDRALWKEISAAASDLGRPASAEAAVTELHTLLAQAGAPL